MATLARLSEGLPSPESDILKSNFFMRFKVSGGPHMDALLYNQGTIMKLIQDVRLIQSRNIGTGIGEATIPTSSGDQGGEDRNPTFAQVGKDILKSKPQTDFLTGAMKSWLEQDKTNHQVAGNRRNQRLATWATSWWAYCKDKLANYWDREEDHWNMEDDDDVFYKGLLESLKIIDGSKVEIEELYFNIGKKATGKVAATGSKRKRTSGATASVASSSGAAAATADDDDEGNGQATPRIVVHGSEDDDDDLPITRRRQRARHGGDATEEPTGDTSFGFDDLYAAEDERKQYLQATVRRREKQKMLNAIYQQAKTSGVWDRMDDAQEEDEEEATRARLAALMMG